MLTSVADTMVRALRQVRRLGSFRAAALLACATAMLAAPACQDARRGEAATEPTAASPHSLEENAPSRSGKGGATDWARVLSDARGKTVRMGMWDGDPLINAYMRDFVAPLLQQRHGVRLQIVGIQGQMLVNRMVVEREAGRDVGDLDVVWINGETFYQLRKINALHGPFTHRLPNDAYIDWANPTIAFDFQQRVAGFECPWGNVQQALIYNSRAVPEPPRTIAQLGDWIQSHPGRFTWDNSFTGMTFLKSMMADLPDGRELFDGPFDEPRYERVAAELWKLVRRWKPHLWRRGETFPEDVAQLHQLFAGGEVDFTMSNNDGEVDNKVAQGVLPETARGYVLDSGSIRNTHYLGIPFNAPEKAAALVLIDLLISPAAQWEKAKPAVWGDGSVLNESRLPEDWRTKFGMIEGRIRVPPRASLDRLALPEPAPELMIRLHADFRREILEGGS